MLMVCLLCTYQVILSHFFVERARNRFLTQEFLHENFGQHHEACFNKSKIQKGGHPDNGDGRYFKKAGYRAWHEFAQIHRVYQNLSENISQFIVSLLIAGMYFPLAAAAWGGMYFLLRIGYHWGYVRSPEARLPFVPFMTNV